jgi:hypothetical protein
VFYGNVHFWEAVITNNGSWQGVNGKKGWFGPWVGDSAVKYSKRANTEKNESG